MSFDIRPADAADLPAVRAILNDAIRTTTAVWYDTPLTVDEMRGWFEQRRAGGYPVLVAVSREDGSGGTVIGYAALGPFRPHHGYRLTAEHSIYVADGLRGRGVGRRLLAAITDEARAMGLHALVGGLDAENTASLALHEAAGFVETARMPEVGAKFGRWLTLVFVQKTLE